jgi:hypothetical protein
MEGGGTGWGHAPAPHPFPQKYFLRSKKIIIIILVPPPPNKLIGPGSSPKKFMCFLLLF